MGERKPRACFCGACGKDHDLEMTPDEFRMMIGISKNSLNKDNRLIMACDFCHPMKLSKDSA